MTGPEDNIDDRDWADRAKVLKAEWFWTSIQIEACADENQYTVLGAGGGRESSSFNEDTLLNSSSACSPAAGPFSDTDGTPNTPVVASANRRKRKRLMREFVSSLAAVEHPPRIMEDLEEDAGEADFLNCVKSPEQSSHNVEESELTVILKRIEKGLQSSELKSKMEAASGKGLKRLNEFAHLVETEKNYVSILMNIVKVSVWMA